MTVKFTSTTGYVVPDDLALAVNAAVALGRPLLVKGEPGTGKTELARQVAQGLGLAEGEEVIAFLYLGTPQKEPRVAEKVDLAEFVSAWPAKA